MKNPPKFLQPHFTNPTELKIPPTRNLKDLNNPSKMNKRTYFKQNKNTQMK
jgi:hypothetical protein